MTLESALITAVATLTGAVTWMGAWFRGQFNVLSTKLNDCEDDRKELWETLAENGINKPAHPARHHRRRKREEEQGEE